MKIENVKGLAAAAAMVTACVLLPVQAWAASSLWVDLAAASAAPGSGCGANAGYVTIASAVAAASAGDTVMVCAGVYAEQVAVDKTLTLLGAKAGIDARTRPAFPPPASESVIAHPCGPVQIMADNVVVNGFTIQGATDGDACFLSGIWTNPGLSATQGGHQILNNVVQNNVSGIELDSTCTFPTTVQFNLIRNNNNPGAGSGSGIETSFGLCHATIDNNTFSGHTTSSVIVADGGGADQNITVSNNDLVSGANDRILFLGVRDSSISGNRSVGSSASGTIRLFGGNSNIAINGNLLRDGKTAILIDNPYNVEPNSGVQGTGNCLVGNRVAGLNASGHFGAVFVRNNWWGSPSGPAPTGTGDAVVSAGVPVDYTPWLTLAPNVSGCVSFSSPAGGGQFVAGDLSNLNGGATVYCWGAQWAKNNPMTSGGGPNAFKGFEDSPAALPACGSSWISRPGNSSDPPPTVPAFMPVIISSIVVKNGPVISGDVKKIAIVQTNSGYGPAPGHVGTGKVIGYVCGGPPPPTGGSGGGGGLPIE